MAGKDFSNNFSMSSVIKPCGERKTRQLFWQRLMRPHDQSSRQPVLTPQGLKWDRVEPVLA